MPLGINSTTELISHKDSVPWNRCQGSLKFLKYRLWGCLEVYKFGLAQFMVLETTSINVVFFSIVFTLSSFWLARRRRSSVFSKSSSSPCTLLNRCTIQNFIDVDSYHRKLSKIWHKRRRDIVHKISPYASVYYLGSSSSTYELPYAVMQIIPFQYSFNAGRLKRRDKELVQGEANVIMKSWLLFHYYKIKCFSRPCYSFLPIPFLHSSVKKRLFPLGKTVLRHTIPCFCFMNSIFYILNIFLVLKIFRHIELLKDRGRNCCLGCDTDNIQPNYHCLF